MNITPVWGYSRLVQCMKIENGRLYLGGFRIDYDREGRETGRTEPTWHGYLSYEEES